MEVKDIREELRRIAGLLGEGPEPIRLSVIEREIVLEKLRRLYEALRFPVGEQAVSVPVDPCLALGADTSGETPRSDREDLSGGESVHGLPVEEERTEISVGASAVVPQTAVSAATPEAAAVVGECGEACAEPETMAAGNAGSLPIEPEAACGDEPCPEKGSVSETGDGGESVFEVVQVEAGPERIAEAKPIAAPSADAGVSEHVPGRSTQALFVGMEEPERRHRHNQRVIMSLYDPDPVVPPVAEAGSYGEALEIISLEDTEEAARLCVPEGDGAVSEPFAAEPAEPVAGTFGAVETPADEEAVSGDPLPVGQSGSAAVESDSRSAVEEAVVPEVVEELPGEEAEEEPVMSVVEELPGEEAEEEPSMSVVGELPGEEAEEEPVMSVVGELPDEETEEEPAMSVVGELPGEEAVAAPTVGVPAERRVAEAPTVAVADIAPSQSAQVRIDTAEIPVPVSGPIAVSASERPSVTGTPAVRAEAVPAAAVPAVPADPAGSVGSAPVAERPVSVAPAAPAATPAVPAEAPRAVRSTDAAPAAGGVLGEVINHDRQTLGETINHDRQTLADVIAPHRDAASELRLGEPIGDLRRAIGLNDRFQMIHELFAGDGDAFDEAIAAFNGCATMDDCMIWICDRGYFWNPDSDGAKRLMELLERKFDR